MEGRAGGKEAEERKQKRKKEMETKEGRREKWRMRFRIPDRCE